MTARSKILFVITLLCYPLTSVLADEIDDAIRPEMARLHVPGAAIAVVRGGKVSLAKGYGSANIEHSVSARATAR